MAENVLWTVDELVAATGGKLEGTVTAALNGVAIDSRSISPGDIFVAIRGDRTDGHEYAASALEAGAGLAVVSRPGRGDAQGGSAAGRGRCTEGA